MSVAAEHLVNKHGKPLYGGALLKKEQNVQKKQEAEVKRLYRLAVERALSNPEWFYTNILTFPAYPWQIRATHAVLDVRRKLEGKPTVVNHEGKPRISIRSCHGPGKTQFIAMLMHLWSFTTRGKIACTAPKEAQLLRRLLPRFRTAMRHSPPTYREQIEVLGREIRFFNDPDWGAVMETATDPESMAGYHDTPQLFLIDEASARKLDPMFPVIEGALTSPGSVCVEIGNPTRMEGEFYNHHNKARMRDLYFLMHVKPEDAPDVISQQWINNMAAKYGEDSPIFKIRVRGEFASYDEASLFPVEYIDNMLNEIRAPDGSFCKLRVSVDVADGGKDSTVITVARHYASFVQVLKQTQHWYPTGESPIKAANKAEEMFYAFGGTKGTEDDFVVDGLGVGAGTVGKLLELGHNVKNFKGGSSSDDPEEYRNLRTQSYISFYNASKVESVIFHPDTFETEDEEEEFYAHLSSIKRNPNSEKVDDIEPKAAIARRGQDSPDRADSAMMQFFENLVTPLDNVTQTLSLIGTSAMANYDAGLT